jgi:uncharacterized protein YndB with AHSA1/START domain
MKLSRHACAIAGHQRFTCSTTANPGQVWSALTEPDQTRTYLYGLAAYSSWQADADIVFRHGERSLNGLVVHTDPPHRLSYVLQASPADPPTYLTWQIRYNSGRSTIRLEVDQTDAAVSDTDEEAEDTWLPVLAALQRLLAVRAR